MKEYEVYVSGIKRDAVLKSVCLNEEDWPKNFNHNEQAYKILDFLNAHVPYQTMVELERILKFYFQ